MLPVVDRGEIIYRGLSHGPDQRDKKCRTDNNFCCPARGKARSVWRSRVQRRESASYSVRSSGNGRPDNARMATGGRVGWLLSLVLLHLDLVKIWRRRTIFMRR